jgi:ATP-binding cassette subfamily B protein
MGSPTAEDIWGSSEASRVQALPEDVRLWLTNILEPGEPVVFSLLADIAPGGEFRENWAFLTDRRVLVLTPNGEPASADVLCEHAIGQIDSVELRQYVGSSALVVTDSDRAHEVVRFSMTSLPEASEMVYHLREAVRRCKEGEGSGGAALPRAARRSQRCPKCGRALRRTGEVCPHCMERGRILARLFTFLMPYKWVALLGLALTLLMTGAQLAPPYLAKVLIDDVIGKRNADLLAVVVGLLISAHVGRALISMVRSYVMQWLGNRVLFDLRVRVYHHLQLLTLTYYNQRQTGQIMQRVTGDLQRLQYFISQGFQEILINVVTMLMIAGILLWMNSFLFLLALAPTPVIFVGTGVFGSYIHRLFHRIWRRYAGLSAMLADTIPGIRVVKSFVQEDRESDRFARRSADLFSQEMRVAKLASGFFPFVGLMSGLGSVLIYGVGGWMVLTGRGGVTLGVLVAFTGYLWQFYMPVQNFGRLNERLQRCVTSAERVFEILDTEVEPVREPGAVVLDPVEGAVEYRDVRFSYEPGKYALNGISFRVEPGEMIGLVGPSGAGKSTLVHLLARFYDVDEGQILIDGHDLRDLALWPYRRQIGVVLQEPYLFHGTIWENIAYANPDASSEEIVAAAKAANAHDFIVKMPDGYDTMIGERGQTLSGGERQRVSIARAILRDPRILILDEATASVDTETESMIQAAIERLVEDRTTFAIAHRLSTLRKASRLVVLERGKVVEVGTHEELVETGGLYSRLCELQAEMSKMRAW